MDDVWTFLPLSRHRSLSLSHLSLSRFQCSLFEMRNERNFNQSTISVYMSVRARVWVSVFGAGRMYASVYCCCCILPTIASHQYILYSISNGLAMKIRPVRHLSFYTTVGRLISYRFVWYFGYIHVLQCVAVNPLHMFGVQHPTYRSIANNIQMANVPMSLCCANNMVMVMER